MTAGDVAAGAAQVVGGIVLAPLLPGLIQHWKARLQGRRGPTPLQPYRELRRLWRKSAVTVEGTTVVYRLAPAVVAASVVALVLLVPTAERAPNWGVGHDVLALAGLLALASLRRRGRGLGRRERLLADGREPRPDDRRCSSRSRLVLSVAVAALVAGTTDLPAIVAGDLR